MCFADENFSGCQEGNGGNKTNRTNGGNETNRANGGDKTNCANSGVTTEDTSTQIVANCCRRASTFCSPDPIHFS
jgi:hypothetical protein